MGGGASKTEDTQAKALVSQEVDNSTSLLHVNIQATLIISICALVRVVFIVTFLPCFCCKFQMCNLFFKFCCNGCQQDFPEQYRAPGITPFHPWGRWPLDPRAPRWPSMRGCQPRMLRACDLEAGGKYASSSAPAPPQQQSSQPPPEPVTEPARQYIVPYPPGPPNSREGS